MVLLISFYCSNYQKQSLLEIWKFKIYVADYAGRNVYEFFLSNRKDGTQWCCLKKSFD